MRQVDEGESRVVLSRLRTVLATGVRGDAVELGCYKGEMSVRLGLELVDTDKDLWLYDSFEGLPEKGAFDGGSTEFARGELAATLDEVLGKFRKQGLVEPFVVKGWFSELTGRELPVEICFAFLDGDFYESIKDSLRLVVGRMTPGGVVVVHDFRNGKLPGVRRAVAEFVEENGVALTEEGGLGVLRF